MFLILTLLQFTVYSLMAIKLSVIIFNILFLGSFYAQALR